MLQLLSIRDFVIVDSLELEFQSGFSVLTGETGAGKSILIDALTLALGGRNEGGVVREGASRADISAVFGLDATLRNWLEEQALSTEDDQVLLRRVIDASGRSRGFINGTAVTAAQMRELGERLIDIHGQHAHQSLILESRQKELLDAHAGLQNLAEESAKRFSEWQALGKQRKTLEVAAQQLAAEKEQLAWQLEILEKIAPKAGEWEEIGNLHSRLSHAASLIQGAQETVQELAESEQPVLSRLYAMQQKIARLSDTDSALAPLADMMESARIQLQEAVYGLNDYLGRVELDPERLAATEKRMDSLYTAARQLKVTPETLPELQAALLEKQEQLLEQSDLAALTRQEAQAETAYREVAGELSQKRQEAALNMSQEVTAAMQELSMKGGQFQVQLLPCEPGAAGLEQVQYLVTGHAGSSLRPLAKIASGGELARIALAISVITSSSATTPTLIFDEVDSGIGGAVAEVVGRFLKKLGGRHQVLCVTHLPQVASQATHHFQVSKMAHASDAIPVSHIHELTADERVEEVARMLGGVEITPTTRQHAREMLSS